MNLKPILTFLYKLYDFFIPHFDKDVIAVKQSKNHPNMHEFLYRAEDVHTVPLYIRKACDGYVTVSVFRWGPMEYAYPQSCTLRDKP